MNLSRFRNTGEEIGAFSLNDYRLTNPSLVYQNGTIPTEGGFELPSDFCGGVVKVEVDAGVYEDTGAGAYFHITW